MYPLLVYINSVDALTEAHTGVKSSSKVEHFPGLQLAREQFI